MFVRKVDLGGFTLEPCVDQFVMTMVTLSNSTMMKQLRCHLLGSEKPSAVCVIVGHTHYKLVWRDNTQLECDYTERRVQQTLMLYASTRDLQAHMLSGESTFGTCRSTEGRDLCMQSLRD
jgi:hypothetical protein